MIRKITFRKENGQKIQGQMHLPEERRGRLPLVIFSHGFGSNYRELMHHGEGFAEAGICCLFFDFCGGGRLSLSDGAMEEMTVKSECRDLETVISDMKKLDYIDPERIVLQGESMGGLVSALVAARYPKDIKALVLWYPAFSIPEDARLRTLTGNHEVFGMALGADFDRQAETIDVYGEISKYPNPVLIIHGTEDAVVPISCSEKALSVYSRSRLIKMPGAEHGYEGADSAAARAYSVSFIKENCVSPGNYI